MTSISIFLPMRAMIRAAWQESFNRSWRFSPAKAGVWTILVQLTTAALAIWQLSGEEPVVQPGLVILFGLLQSSLFAFVTLFLRGRMKLYGGPVVQLIHLSPAPAQAAIAAEVLSQLPGRLWNSLVFTAALWPILAPEARLWAGPALWLAIVLGGLMGHLAGLLALMAWVRLAPQSLGAVWILSMVGTLALCFYVGYLLLGGVAPAAVAGALAGAGAALPLGLGLLLGLPGAAMLVRLIARPRQAGEIYREGWLGLMELGDAAGRPRRSRWPRIAPGPAGALAALVWLMALRNWMSLIRLGLLAACWTGIALSGPALAKLPAERLTPFVLGLGLAAALLNYGEQASALFAADGPRIALAALAGVRPGQMLVAKWLAASPLALVAAITAGLAAQAARQPFAFALAMAGTALAIGLLCLTWIIGTGAFDALPREHDLGQEGEQLAAALEQAPTRLGGMAGLLGSVTLGAAGVWLVGVHPAWLGLLAVLPLLALGAGYARLRHLLANGIE